MVRGFKGRALLDDDDYIKTVLSPQRRDLQRGKSEHSSSGEATPNFTKRMIWMLGWKLRLGFAIACSDNTDTYEIYSRSSTISER